MIRALAIALALAAGPAAAFTWTVPEYVRSISPSTPERRVQQVSKAIEWAAKKTDEDPYLLAAIVYVESRFRPSQKACWEWIDWDQKVCRYTCDYGLGQVNEVWIKAWKLDADKLQNDDYYNLLIAAKILHKLRLMYGTEPQWWSRYHHARDNERVKYERLMGPALKVRYPDE